MDPELLGIIVREAAYTLDGAAHIHVHKFSHINVGIRIRIIWFKLINHLMPFSFVFFCNSNQSKGGRRKRGQCWE